MPRFRKQVEPTPPDYRNLGYRSPNFFVVKSGTGNTAFTYGYISHFYWAIHACESMIIDQILRADLKIKYQDRYIKPRWLDNPNPLDDYDNFIGKSTISLLRDGNIFATLHRSNGASPQVIIHDPFTVDTEFDRSTNQIVYRKGQTETDYTGTFGKKLENVIHIADGILPGDLRAYGLVPVLEELFEIGKRTKRHHLRSLDLQRSMIAFQTGLDEIDPDTRKLSQERLASSLSIKDDTSAAVIALAENEKLEFPTADVNTDIIRAEKTIASQICALYGIDYSLMNIVLDNSSDTYSNESDRLFVMRQLALEPVAKKIATLIKRVINVSSVEVWFDFEELTGGNENEIAEQHMKNANAAKNLFEAGFNKDEIIRILHIEELENEDELDDSMKLRLDLE